MSRVDTTLAWVLYELECWCEFGDKEYITRAMRMLRGITDRMLRGITDLHEVPGAEKKLKAYLQQTERYAAQLEAALDNIRTVCRLARAADSCGREVIEFLSRVLDERRIVK